MKSIRLSLMVYFLALLAVALAAASLLVYHIAQQTLQDKQRAMAQVIQTQYGDRCQEEKTRLDNVLLWQAQSLAKLVQVQFDFSRGDHQPLFLLGMIGLPSSSSGYVQMPLWIAEAYPPPPTPPQPPPQPRGDSRRSESPRPNPYWLQRQVHNLLLTTGVALKQDVLLPGDDVRYSCDFFQIDVPRGKSHYSDSMADRKFMLDTAIFSSEKLIDFVHDDTTLAPDIRVRRVVLKATGVETAWAPRNLSEGRPDSTRVPRGRTGPTIYVHCAAELNKLDTALGELEEYRDEKLAEVQEQTDYSLRSLRHWLWAISLSVFSATAVGSFWLVRLGLTPLQRLSHAVSRVSVKDFRLPLDEQPLPLELRPIAERLTTTLNLLKRAFAREKQSVADISHELRTPLAALMTTTDFALRKPRSAEQYRELLGDVHASAQQMNQIVERLLILARLDAGVDRLRLQTVDAAALAQQCAAVIRPLAEARDLKLAVKSPPLASAFTTVGGCGDNGCTIQTDPDKLREIVTNLLHNAIQYNRPGGGIDLCVTRANGALEVEVQDTGIGIATEARERIFERFYRVDPSRGGDDLHAGLGLAIVKEYVELMGGSIGVESIEGQGSTFRVLLPVH